MCVRRQIYPFVPRNNFLVVRACVRVCFSLLILLFFLLRNVFGFGKREMKLLSKENPIIGSHDVKFNFHNMIAFGE